MSLRKQTLLSRDILDSQLSQIDLLTAMYPAEDELIVDSATRGYMNLLREYVEHPHFDHEDVDGDAKLSVLPDFLSFELHIDTETDSQTIVASPENSKIQLTIEFPIRQFTLTRSSTNTDTNTDIDEINTQPRPVKIRLRQPPHLNKSQTAQINDSLPPELEGDLVSTIDHLRTAASLALISSTTTTAPSHNHPPTPTPLVRVWFYFPSLSTRSKRTDLVTYARSHSLTGFVLAGKPGLLCVEGDPRSIDEYMRTIKTESWGDIPSYQKKVSERYRETLTWGEDGKEGRVFEGMQEITGAEWLGAKRGERGNRSDLGVVEGWLVGKGLGGVFERVLS